MEGENTQLCQPIPVSCLSVASNKTYNILFIPADLFHLDHLPNGLFETKHWFSIMV